MTRYRTMVASRGMNPSKCGPLATAPPLPTELARNPEGGAK